MNNFETTFQRMLEAVPDDKFRAMFKLRLIYRYTFHFGPNRGVLSAKVIETLLAHQLIMLPTSSSPADVRKVSTFLLSAYSVIVMHELKPYIAEMSNSEIENLKFAVDAFIDQWIDELNQYAEV